MRAAAWRSDVLFLKAARALWPQDLDLALARARRRHENASARLSYRHQGFRALEEIETLRARIADGSRKVEGA